MTGAALTEDAIGAMPARTPAEIEQYLGKINAALNVDASPQAEAFADGLLLLRYLFGLRGAALIDGAIGQGATRTGPDIET